MQFIPSNPGFFNNMQHPSNQILITDLNFYTYYTVHRHTIHKLKTAYPAIVYDGIDILYVINLNYLNYLSFRSTYATLVVSEIFSVYMLLKK